MSIGDSLEGIANDGITTKGLVRLYISLFAGYILIFLSIAGYFIDRSNDLGNTFYDYMACNEDREAKKRSGDLSFTSCRVGKR